MTVEDLLAFFGENPLIAFGALVALSFALFFLARVFIGRGLIYISRRTATKNDDIIVNSLRPFRVAWLVPLAAIYAFADLLPGLQRMIEGAALVMITWVVALTLTSLLNALNELYESSPNYTGLSIAGYLDIGKLLLVIIAVIISIAVITGQSPAVLLTGLGALTAVLLLVFRDTILSLVASIQISTLDLVKEGDWLEVPSYGADGVVINMSLHTIKIQNWDKTISVIPTYKITEVAYRNWRGMTEAGARRIKRSFSIDMASVRFCSAEMLEAYRRIPLLKDHLAAKEREISSGTSALGVPALAGRRLTNLGVFRAYVDAYLRELESIHQIGMTLLVRPLSPSPTGLPLEIYAFTRTTDWAEYEAIQADIFDHLIAIIGEFGLRIFQEPTGKDFARISDR